jgi:hypothetical protein
VLRARRFVLAIVAIVFGAIALASLIVPDTMADGLGYRLDNVDARNEFRAIYVGLWLATCTIFAASARRPDDRSLFFVCVLLLAGQVAGRLGSLALDGVPSMKVATPFMVETLGVVALFLLRPRTTP